MSSKESTLTSIERMFSASAGAIVTTCFMNPLDVVKTRLQEGTRYKGTVDGLSNILRNEGVFALWRGLVPGFVMALPSTVIYFVGYDQIRDYTSIQFKDTAIDAYAPLWAGGLARTFSAIAVSPLELFKTRMQSAHAQNFAHVWRGVAQMIQQNGPQALWRGLLPTLFRDVPFSSVYWFGYEEIKKNLTVYQLSEFEVSFLSGATSGMFAAVITTPFDVIKTQRQVSSEGKLDVIIKDIIRKDGPTGFFRGVVPRVVRVAPACAIMISSYEMGKRFFSNRRLVI